MSELNRLSLDEFLETEPGSIPLVIVEPVDGAPDVVRVTPWSADGGCRCSEAFRVPRGAIAWLRPTGDLHHCCGGAHRVCQVEWQEGASVPVDSLLSERQASSAVRRSAAPVMVGGGEGGPTLPGEPGPTPLMQELDPSCAADCARHARFFVRNCWGRFSSGYCNGQMNARYLACLDERECYWLFPWRHPVVAPRF